MEEAAGGVDSREGSRREVDKSVSRGQARVRLGDGREDRGG